MKLTITSTASLLALSLLGTVACSKKEESQPTDQAAAPAAPAPAPKDPSTLITGSKPTIPDVFQGIAPGTTIEEATKKVPGFDRSKPIPAAEFPDISFFVYAPKDSTRIENVRFELPKDKALALVTSKWGEPVVGEDLGKPVQFWFNPESEIVASLKDGYGEGSDLTFSQYSPAQKLLGEGKDIAFLSKAPVLGATVDELKAAYGQWLHVESDQEAQDKKAAIDKLTDGKSAGITTAEPKAYLDLPPTEYGSQFMRVNLNWKDGKVESYRFALAYRSVKAKKDEIFALVEKKWGAPKKEEKYGDPQFVFSEKPFIVVVPDDIGDAWDVKVSAKR